MDRSRGAGGTEGEKEERAGGENPAPQEHTEHTSTYTARAFPLPFSLTTWPTRI